jgi:parallel beta-helix repeat protein
LDEALDGVGPDTVIRVADGTYVPSVQSEPGTERTETFQLVNGVTIEGGYAGCSDGGDLRDVVLYETILSGDIGTSGVVTDNCYHVVTGSGTDATAVLDGFTITAAYGRGSSPLEGGGGGMRNESGSPTLTNCVFEGNRVSHRGAGMYNFGGSSPTLTNCTFSGNYSENLGGGMCNEEDSSPTLTNCTFVGNRVPSSDAYGGGMYNWVRSSPTLTHCDFIGNSGGNTGGGMVNSYQCSPTVTNCTFSGNTARGSGGGMTNSRDCNPTLTNCTFSGNLVTTSGAKRADGGGVYNFESNPTLINCTFSGNRVERYGGGMYNSGKSGPTVTNCTFSGNLAESEGGGMFNSDSSPTLANCIVWGNFASDGPEIWDDATSTTNATYSCIRGGWDGEGNISAAPRFSGDFRLAPGSPCIDAGNNAEVPEDECDLDGDGDTSEPCPKDQHGLPRFWRGQPSTYRSPPVVDMGAYEHFFFVRVPAQDVVSVPKAGARIGD